MENYVENRVSIILVPAFLGATIKLGDDSFVVNFSASFADNPHDRSCCRPVWTCRTWANITLEQVEQVKLAPTRLIPLAMGEKAGGARGQQKGA